ncbi:MAG: ThuA domain-containing protein, partial [Pseudomonadota bacterium]
MVRVLIALLIAASPAHSEPYPWPRSGQYLREPAVLVFSKTRDWRHESGIPAATLFVVETAEELGMGVHSTEDGRIFNDADLSRFSIVVMNNVTGAAIEADEQKVLEKWIAAGGGVLAIHGAGDGSMTNWRWYLNTVIGAEFTGHPMGPQFQDAGVHVLSPGHPVTEGLPLQFIHNDEWYSFTAPPRGPFIPLLGLDESTYQQSGTVFGPPERMVMGPTPSDHPVAWATCAGTGRIVYSALGHRAQAYKAP